MRRLVSVGVLLLALLLTVSGCVATRNWVNEVLGTKEAQIDDRFRRVDAAVGEAGDTARQARGRADSAYGRADAVDDRLSRLWTGRHKRSLVETLNVQFGFDRWDLSDAAQTALLNLVKDLKANLALTVELEGFTDQVGTYAYNIGLSQRRVESVRRYLIENGAELPRITAVGFGKVSKPAPDEDPARQRRVTVRLMTPID